MLTLMRIRCHIESCAGQQDLSFVSPTLVLQNEEDHDLPEEGEKGIEMEADFDGQYEDIPENEQDSADEEQDGDEDNLQQEMGDVGDAGETVDERLWNNDDKSEEGQNGPEKHEKDSTVQVIL